MITVEAICHYDPGGCRRISPRVNAFLCNQPVTAYMHAFRIFEKRSLFGIIKMEMNPGADRQPVKSKVTT